MVRWSEGGVVGVSEGEGGAKVGWDGMGWPEIDGLALVGWRAVGGGTGRPCWFGVYPGLRVLLFGSSADMGWLVCC